MPLSQRLNELIEACFTCIWIESHEHEDALAEMAQLCKEADWRLAVWDLEQGLRIDGGTAPEDSQDPVAAIRALPSLAPPRTTKASAEQDDDNDPADATHDSALLVLVNLHRFMHSAELVQALAHQAALGKDNRTFVVILAPIVQLPVELEKLFIVVEHDLPSRSQLEEIARGVATEAGELPAGQELPTVLDAAAGLTRHEAENAFSLSLVRHDRITAETIWELKSQMLKKSGLLQLHRGAEDFSSLGGLAALKAFTKRALLQPSRGNPLKQPRGVLLLSPPGCGKSAFCKALGKETQRPVLILDVGQLMGSLVGQTEERTRQALQIAAAMAPCVLMLDECEKAFSGASGSQGDGGVSSRMFGYFLSWLNDHDCDVFTVCTANDVSKLPPEFSRAERFDGVFFVDLPGREEKDAIWQLYRALFEIDPRQRIPTDDHWTGAEIRSCCRLAALLDLPLSQAAQNVVPVAITAAESVERLRTWASGRCLSASTPGIYQKPTHTSDTRRRITRASNN